MNRTMITAVNTLSQLQKQLDIISNNMANVDTNGYKRRQTSFADLLVQQFNNQPNQAEEIGRLTPFGIRQGVGAKLAQSQMISDQGSIKNSDRPLDTAFTRENQLYRVLTPNNGIQYTRDGALYLTPVSAAETMLVTGDGYPILDENNNPIYLDGQASDFRILQNGQLIVAMQDGTEQKYNLGVSLVKKPQFLENKGGNLLGVPENFNELGLTEEDIFTNLTGDLRGEISIQQFALEHSNVDVATEMTDLMNVQRAYQFQSRAVTLSDQMMGLVNGLR
ncbi:flagellar hook-basal body protein [Bacillaceae bacterium Marseille-Q3522]|nr:flagellar hook-basal body protein [Bacillaceae bacterium Marseille-Q3522]